MGGCHVMLIPLLLCFALSRSNSADSQHSHHHHHHHHHNQYEQYDHTQQHPTAPEGHDKLPGTASPQEQISKLKNVPLINSDSPKQSNIKNTDSTKGRAASMAYFNAASPHSSEGEGILAHVKSDINGEIWVKEDVVMEMGTDAKMSEVVERSMYFQAAMGAQSVTRCLSANSTTLNSCCLTQDSSCCIADPHFIPDGYLGISLLSFSMFEAMSNGTRSAKRILVVGLGGGNLPTFVRNNFKDVDITVVEIDQQVVNCATKFFGLCIDKNVHIQVQSIQDFVTSTQAADRWDIVFLDAFVKNELPQAFVTTAFFGSLRSLLVKGGILVANVFSVSPNRIKSVCGVIRKYFPEFTVLNQLPLEMSVVAFSANVDRRGSAIFDYSHMLASVKAMVGRKILPEVLSLIASSKHFRDSMSRPVSTNSSVSLSQNIVSWH